MATEHIRKFSPYESQIANIAPVPLRYLAMVLESRGYDPQAVFPPAIRDFRTFLCGDTRISFQLGHTIIRNAVKLTRDANLGLAVAARKSFASGGLLSLALLASRNGLDAIHTGMEFDLEGGNMMTLLAIAKFEEITTLRFLTDDLVASVAGFARGISRNENIVLGAEFTFDAGKYRTNYERYFKCPIRFNGVKNSVTLDYRIMQQPLRTSDPWVLAEATNLLARKAKRLSGRNAFLSSVESIIRSSLRDQHDQKYIARQLAMSERGLRRKLAEHNTSFSKLLADVRRDRAADLINYTDLSIEEISVELGFADGRTFRQAFKNWTGESPASFRKASKPQ